jgi:hypothetical protein
MNHYFILLTRDFCESHINYISGSNAFSYVVTTDGRYVTSANALNIFPWLFSNINPTFILLSSADFTLEPEGLMTLQNTILSDLIPTKIAQLKSFAINYINSHFNYHEIFAMYNQTNGILMGAWVSGVMAYVQTLNTQIRNSVDTAQLNSVVWDFTQFDATVPNIQVYAMDPGQVMNMKDRDFGTQIVVCFAAANEASGITAAGKTFAVLSYAGNLSNILQSGSLIAALVLIKGMIADTGGAKTACSPFITNALLTDYKNKIQTYLGLPHD